MPSRPHPTRLYAVVPAEEGSTLKARRRFSILTCGPAAALFGHSPDHADPARAALQHDRIVASALESCSSVIPFRLGTDFASATELHAVVSRNAGQLAEQLGRFRGRVEMGLKVGLAAADQPFCLPAGLDRVRALAPQPADRCERLGRSRQGKVFAGCYLISRPAIEDFWRAVEAIRSSSPGLPLLGSGPWAPYSFCDAPLRPGVVRGVAF
ncbi:MAG TPA: GvpL/GvpF family gas vesicle protein [Thermoanaerobaculia bacterium]|nr:GvpL/GvpF family gas vesicle protein [Thermoanaerobaculia bacterium]